MSCSIIDPTGCVSSVAKAAAGDAFDSIAHDFSQAASSAVNWLWGQVSTATVVHLGGHGFDLDVGIVAAITVVVAVGLFTIQVFTAAIRRDPGGLARAMRGLLVAFVGGGVAIGVTDAALSAIDSLSAGAVQVATGGSIGKMGDQIIHAGALGQAVTNPAALLVLSVATIIAVLIVWVALAIRKVLIVISAVFAPLAFAGSLADITVSWTRRWIEVTAALIISKLILVMVFIVGLGMLVDGVGQAGNGTTQTVTQTVSGILVLALAGFAPWMALKLVHFSGDHFQQIHAMAGSATHGARTAMAVPQKAAAWQATAAGAVGGTLGRGGAVGSAARPAGPSGAGGGSAVPAVLRAAGSGKGQPGAADALPPGARGGGQSGQLSPASASMPTSPQPRRPASLAGANGSTEQRS